VRLKTVNGTSRWRTIALLAIGLSLGSAITATPVASHVGGTVSHLWTKHIRPKTDARYYTKAQAEGRFVSSFETASNADRLDFRDSSDFLGSDMNKPSSFEIVSAGSTASESVSCAFGKATGGGFSASSSALYAISSEPSFNGWTVTMGNTDESFSHSFTVYAVCAS
jgi:hypothetical protein